MRTTTLSSALGALMLATLASGSGCGAPPANLVATHALSSGWALRAAADVAPDGGALSRPGFDDSGWLHGRVPTTVMAARVAAGELPDLYVGTRLDDVPTEPYAGPWWYRVEFSVDAAEAGRVARLRLDGVNSSADVWLNGALLARREEIRGAFRTFELDVTGRLTAGTNALAVQVFPPAPGDFTIGFVDWNPRPPDRNMGLWRPVTLHLSGAVTLDRLAVDTEVDLDTLDAADLRVSALATNRSAAPVEAAVTGTIGEIHFSTDVALAAGEAREVVFTPDSDRGLHLTSPRLWWPHTLGEPELYRLDLRAEVAGRVSDEVGTSFGIRQFSTYLNEQGHRGFRVNGREVLIRGGGWVDDLLLGDTPEKIAAQMAYVKHMGLNTIRLEGFWGSDHTLYDLADREGVLVMPGWSCQWEWEEYLGKPVDETYGGVVEPEDMDLVAASLADQVRWLRNHASIFTWVLASDLLPHPDLERRYEAVLAETDPTRPPLVSCGWYTSEVSGPTGVKMNGPYDWVPPVYWYEDRERGGAFGFNTETGPGPQPPPLESLRRMIPPEHLWPPDEVWNFHCGRNEFNTPDRYVEAVNRRYGASTSAEEFLRKAQAASYEAIRPMFEAFAVNRPLSTGVIQWMLNSAWPEMYWQLYDHYLLPNGAFYGTRAACRPISLAYDYHAREVYAVNDTPDPVEELSATVRAFDLASREILHETVPVTLAPGSSRRLLSVADLRPATPVYFLALLLTDPSGAEVARNFYWLPTRGDELDWDQSLWFVTPVRRHADLTALADLPQVTLEAEAGLESADDGAGVTVHLANPSDAVAFFIELRVVDESDRSFVPVLWNDNYVSLLPGEERVLTARLPWASPPTAILELAGWNVPELTLHLAR